MLEDEPTNAGPKATEKALRCWRRDDGGRCEQPTTTTSPRRQVPVDNPAARADALFDSIWSSLAPHAMLSYATRWSAWPPPLGMPSKCQFRHGTVRAHCRQRAYRCLPLKRFSGRARRSHAPHQQRQPMRQLAKEPSNCSPPTAARDNLFVSMYLLPLEVLPPFFAAAIALALAPGPDNLFV